MKHAKSQPLVKAALREPIRIGRHFRLTENGLEVTGRPTFEEYLGVGDYIRWAHMASGWWLADWLAYGDGRTDWKPKLEAMMGPDIIKDATARQYRYIAKTYPPSNRVRDLSFGHHAAVVNLPEDLQREALTQALDEELSKHETQALGRRLLKHKVIEGQAVLEGLYRCVIADPPWSYGDAPPSGSRASSHYPTMTIGELCKLPVQAHLHKNAVMFMWVTAPMLYEHPGPREVLVAWGLTPKTGMVWRKRRHGFGHYVSIRHEHVIIATRGSCTPDRPTPMPDSVFTSEQEDLAHSEKPDDLRKIVEKLYDGPYLELFARKKTDGWVTWGNDPRAWPTQTEAAV